MQVSISAMPKNLKNAVMIGRGGEFNVIDKKLFKQALRFYLWGMNEIVIVFSNRIF
jgi:hypothetical protein